jgi:hypothetical protein
MTLVLVILGSSHRFTQGGTDGDYDDTQYTQCTSTLSAGGAPLDQDGMCRSVWAELVKSHGLIMKLCARAAARAALHACSSSSAHNSYTNIYN